MMDGNMEQDRNDLLDAAAGEALGANSKTDSETFRAALNEGANEQTLRTERALRETVARLAAVSPYMNPPEALRGKVLQATAPQTFRMEAYRKATHETGRFYRWGLVAATLFLVAAAWYNMSLQKTLQATQQQLAVAAHAADARGEVLAKLINPKTDQIKLMRDGKVAATAFVDDATSSALLVVPDGTIPAGKTIREITLERDGVPKVFKTIVVAMPADGTGPNKAIDEGMRVRNIQPAAKPVYEATFR